VSAVYAPAEARGLALIATPGGAPPRDLDPAAAVHLPAEARGLRPAGFRAAVAEKAPGTQVIPVPEPVPKPDQARTIAHLTDTVLTALGHSVQHNLAAQAASDPVSKSFNERHVARHLAEAVEHQRHLISVLAAYHPAIAREMNLLHQTTQPGPAVLPPSPRAQSRSRSGDDYDVNPPDRGPGPAFAPRGRDPEPY
jgi:hypothetical protein